MDITYLNELFKLCIVPILGALATFIAFWIKAKTKELQSKTDDEKLQSCLSILEITVTNAVIATNQTYVESLKDKNEEGKIDLDSLTTIYVTTGGGKEDFLSDEEVVRILQEK